MKADADAMFAIVDRKNALAIATGSDDECMFVSCNAAPVVARAAVEAAVAVFFSMIKTLSRDILDV